MLSFQVARETNIDITFITIKNQVQANSKTYRAIVQK